MYDIIGQKSSLLVTSRAILYFVLSMGKSKTVLLGYIFLLARPPGKSV